MRTLLLMIWFVSFVVMQSMNATASSNPLFRPFLFNNQNFSGNFGIILREAKDPLAKYLWDGLSDETKVMIRNYDGVGLMPQSLRDKLMQDMNRILTCAYIYDEMRFRHVSLSESLRKLIRQKPAGDELIRLNRLLLYEAYPQDIRGDGFFYIIGKATVYLGFPMVRSQSKTDVHDLMTDDTCVMMKSELHGAVNLCVSLDRVLVYNLPCRFQYLAKNRELPYNIYCLVVLECHGGNTLMYGISDDPKEAGWLNIDVDGPSEDVTNIILDFVAPVFDIRKLFKDRRPIPSNTGQKYFPEEKGGPEGQDVRMRFLP